MFYTQGNEKVRKIRPDERTFLSDEGKVIYPR